MQGMLSKPVPAAAMRALLQGGARLPSPDPPDAGGLLDATRLEELRRDLPAPVLAGLCRQCLEDIDQRLRLLGAAMAREDPDGMEREAHALAGMAGSYGLAEVERQARAVLAAARRQDLPAAGAAAASLQQGFARSRAALLAWLPAG